MKTNPNDSATGFAWSSEQRGTSGLTKREYFAAIAMQGVVSNRGMIDTVNWEWLVKESVFIADALIEELNK